MVTMIHFLRKETKDVVLRVKDRDVNISRSIRRLTNLFIILFIALSGGLVYWQVVAAQQVTSNTFSTFSRQCSNDNAPIRGRILDRNGVVLAESKPVGPHNPHRGILCGYQRYYYEPSLAGLIGYYISPLFGSTGIEQHYNNYLSGQVGVTGLTNTLNHTLHLPPVGDDIYLTIDVRIQRIVAKYFKQDANVYPFDNHNIFPTDRGSVVVTDPHSGEILAMLSSPGYDPNRIASGDLDYFHQVETDPEQPLLERPLVSRYVPGSSYKTVTLLAALDSRSSQLSDQFDMAHAIGPVVIGPPRNPATKACITIPPASCGDGSETFGPVGNNIASYTRNYPVDLEYGFVHSDNIIFAQVGAKMGVDTWLNYNRRFYVGQKIPFDLPVAVSTVTPPGGQLSLRGLAENSFGQGVDFVTPFQMSLFDDAIANNGHLMRPRLVMKIVDPTNSAVVQSSSPQELGTPISQDTASQMRRAMYGVVRCGSGSVVAKLIGSPWAVMAKTGTGEVGGGKPPQAWLVTQAPYDNPALTIVAQRENGGEGGYVTGPIVADIYNDVFSNIMHLPQPPPPDPNYCSQI
jgi:peptidoglycan glycosyltransferase